MSERQPPDRPDQAFRLRRVAVRVPEDYAEDLRRFARELRTRQSGEPAAASATQWRRLSPSAEMLVDPGCQARGIIRDTRARGADRFHWSPWPQTSRTQSWPGVPKRLHGGAGLPRPPSAPSSRTGASNPTCRTAMTDSGWCHLGPVWAPKSAPIWRRRRQIAARKALLLEAVPGARRLVLTTQFLRRNASGHESEHANGRR
jgi:hypothetical protein